MVAATFQHRTITVQRWNTKQSHVERTKNHNTIQTHTHTHTQCRCRWHACHSPPPPPIRKGTYLTVAVRCLKYVMRKEENVFATSTSCILYFWLWRCERMSSPHSHAMYVVEQYSCSQPVPIHYVQNLIICKPSGVWLCEASKGKQKCRHCLCRSQSVSFRLVYEKVFQLIFFRFWFLAAHSFILLCVWNCSCMFDAALMQLIVHA